MDGRQEQKVRVTLVVEADPAVASMYKRTVQSFMRGFETAIEPERIDDWRISERTVMRDVAGSSE